MKHIILLFIVLALLPSGIQAQSDTLFFVKDGKVVNKQAISLSSVDSITFSRPGKPSVTSNDTLYFMKHGQVVNKQAVTQAIDSAVFYNPEKNEEGGFVLIDNHSVWSDTNGEEIKAQGGCIIQDGNTFHWIGPHFEAGNYNFRAINHYTSTDLVSWTKQAPLLTPSSPGLSAIPVSATSWVGRPWVMKRAENDYVMWIEMGKPSGGAYRNRFGVFAAPSISGPWTFVRQYESLADKTGTQRALGDLGAFHDLSTGQAYILYTFDRDETNGYQAITKLSSDFRSVDTVVAEFKKSQYYCMEAAAIFKRAGTYYYIMSETRGWKPSNTWYRTATEIGPESVWASMKQVPLDPSSGSVSYYTQHDFVLPVMELRTLPSLLRRPLDHLCQYQLWQSNWPTSMVSHSVRR
jgi:hypothetical protein